MVFVAHAPEAARAQAAAPPAAPPQAPFAAAPQQASRPEAAPPQPAQRARPEASHLEAQRAPRASAADLNDAHAELKRGRFHKPLLFGAIAGGALGALFFFTPDEAGPSKQTTAAVSVRADSGAIGASLPPNRIADPETQPHKASPDASAQEAQRPPAERPKGIAAESDFSKAFREAAAR